MIPTVDSGNGFLSKVGISASSKVRDEQIQALARTRVESLETVCEICIPKSKLEQIRLYVRHIVLGLFACIPAWSDEIGAGAKGGRMSKWYPGMDRHRAPTLRTLWSPKSES